MLARKPHQNSLSRHSAISRAVAGLLLVFVIYGTTIEAAHRHGRILGSGSTSTSASSPTQHLGDIRGGSSCSECLICQLQQHFSASLVSVPYKDSPVSSRSEIYRQEISSVHTRAVATQTGRGPPLAS